MVAGTKCYTKVDYNTMHKTYAMFSLSMHKIMSNLSKSSVVIYHIQHNRCINKN